MPTQGPSGCRRLHNKRGTSMCRGRSRSTRGRNWWAVAAGGRGHRPRRYNSNTSITRLTAILNLIRPESSRPGAVSVGRGADERARRRAGRDPGRAPGHRLPGGPAIARPNHPKTALGAKKLLWVPIFRGLAEIRRGYSRLSARRTSSSEPTRRVAAMNRQASASKATGGPSAAQRFDPEDPTGG
jgi:hypothetical protein